MDTIQNSTDNYFDSSTMLLYFGIILLLVALYFIRKNVYRLDVYLNARRHTPDGYVGKPWHISWSLLLGIVFLLSQVVSSGEAERFNSEFPGIFFSNPHPWHWFWLLLLLSELTMFIIVVLQSVKHFGGSYGLIRSIVIILLMCLYFWTGMYTGLIFAAAVGLYLIYRVFRMFYGRKKGLLTS
ncbi:MAG: hypothetical protein DRI72_03860 [Bacteroidetes bacterium]|nr:MAG: hypothetical protein DRI72_03860 [Bacteroidota bacterium]RLD74083.1 MAG: hypothetical protein DRI87_02120 [Bacteroidota bacterium]